MALPINQLSGVTRALFTDLDGTLTTNGRVEARTYAALERLGEAGVPVIIVTGRPSGWGQAIMTMVAVAAVVSENGGVTYVRRDGKLDKYYGLPAAALPEWRRKMHAATVDICAEVPGAKLSTDSRYREVDLAIDWNEEVSLPVQAADQVVEALRARGFTAVKSSVHVNFGPPGFDKLSACKTVVERVLGGDPNQLEPYIFVGDALNDAPMFGGFPRSVGVANVRDWWNELSAHPTYVTEAREGAGLRELVDQILS
jgi:HAD superfamily hydrolase (TIGR01484 family)